FFSTQYKNEAALLRQPLLYYYFLSVEQPQPFEQPPLLPEPNDFLTILTIYQIANPNRKAIKAYCT
ncbi:hypothetical protein, partial [Chishuiella sp.]|uniref:hypothetical protein n=1 Tax=Chishuiella sp. TaxID=1969467 RepID=UPI0028A5E5D7